MRTEPSSPSQLSPQSTAELNHSTTTNNAAVSSRSSMPYLEQSSNFNDAWAAHQQQQYFAQISSYKSQLQHQYQHQQHQYERSTLGMQGYNAYPNQFDPQNHSGLSYQSTNAYYGNGVNGNNQASTSSHLFQQPHFQQHQFSQASFPSSNKIQAVKSPRQQFTETLRKGVENIAFTPAGSITSDSKNTGRVSQMAALPARPDSAIRAAQATQGGGDVESTMQSTLSNNSQSSRGAMATTLVGSTLMPTLLPPRQAPSLPLASRFPPLPSKPPLREESTSNEKELYEGFEAREYALLLRVDALGFQPEAAWQVMKEAVDSRNQEEGGGAEIKDRETAAPILGIRLLQRLDLLQKENDELESMFGEKIQKRDDGEVQNALCLIDALDDALTAANRRAEKAEARVANLEKALAIACDERSSAITNPSSANPSSGVARSANTSPQWQKASLQSR